MKKECDHCGKKVYACDLFWKKEKQGMNICEDCTCFYVDCSTENCYNVAEDCDDEPLCKAYKEKKYK